MKNLFLFILIFLSLSVYAVQKVKKIPVYEPPDAVSRKILSEKVKEDFPIEDTSIFEPVNKFFNTYILKNNTPVKIGGKWGVINGKGEVTVCPKFSTSFSFDNELERIISGDCSNENRDKLCRKMKNGLCRPSACKTGYINKEGKVVIPPIYESLVYFKKDGKLLFKESGSFSEGFAPVLVQANKKFLFGFINAKGKMVIKPIFDEASPFFNGTASVVFNGEERKIDKKGNYVKDEVGGVHIGNVKSSTCSEKYIYVRKGKDVGMSSVNKKILIPVKYRIIINPEILRMNKRGEDIYSFVFCDVFYAYHNTENGLAGNRFTAYDKDGKIMFESNNLREFKGNRKDFEVLRKERMGNKWVYINKSGKYIPGMIFEAASDFNENGIAVVKKGNKFGLINVKMETVKIKLKEVPNIVKTTLIIESSFKQNNIGISYEKLKESGMTECKAVNKTVSEQKCKVTTGPLITCKSDDFVINYKYRWIKSGCLGSYLDTVEVIFRNKSDCQSALKELVGQGYKKDKTTLFRKEDVFTKTVKNEKMLMLDECSSSSIVFFGFQKDVKNEK